MKMFSLSYFIYLAICAIICIAFYFIFKNKSKKTQFIAILIPLFLSFIIHFLKLLIPIYRDQLPSSIMSITPETICAISTLAFPFIYISKSVILKNYMVILGVISGFLTLIVPGDIIGINPLNIEVMRFFFAHLVIFMCPLFMYIFNIHRPKGKWIKHTLLTLLVVLTIMVIDNIAFTFILEGKESGIEYLEKQLGIITQE